MKKYNNLESLEYVGYKDIDVLKKYISDQGKILPRRITNLSNKNHRIIVKSIKRARIIGWIAFSQKYND
uniref:Ribosomal protein S18 n=1 Tax=Cyanidium sp. THAL103 TaxID=3027999 RepID=A0A9Y1MY16_9RHOD|nr:ribosomal protein S18 [Cyanidium sp. THAL103]